MKLELVGMTLKDAEDWARREGYTLRVVAEDGSRYVITDDFDPNRIDVDVRKGIIHAIR